jgi:hypothetical protein
MDIKAALARAKAELDDAEAQFKAAQERMRKLEAVRDGLELAVDMYELDEAGAEGQEDRDTTESTESGSVQLRRLPGIPDPPAVDGKPAQVDIAYAAVKERGEEIATTAVRVRAADAGYPLKYDQVRGALTWLEKQERIVRVAPGVWALPPAVTNSPMMNGHVVVRRP